MHVLFLSAQVNEASPASTWQILLAIGIVLGVAFGIGLLLVFCAVLSSKPTRISPPPAPAVPQPRQPVSSHRKAARREAQR